MSTSDRPAPSTPLVQTAPAVQAATPAPAAASAESAASARVGWLGVDWRRPPRWLGLLLLPGDVYLTARLTEKHGLAVGVLAAVVYGGLTFMPLFFERVSAWSKAHPVLDSLVLIPLIFLALAYLTPMSLAMCAAITAACGLPWAAVTIAVRRRRHA
ncbi:hypothetical protein [Sphaerisporangium dianthi]|uniref:Uncharacterized protein n=1 Tax=Sphaerisporangium dianthi TaxID=1436120 RepID=A0ABV9CLU7_9ACTN